MKRASADASPDQTYHSLFETLSDAIIILDAETCQFIEANDSAVDLFGWTRDELLALRLDDVAVDPEAMRTAFQQTVTEGRLRIPERDYCRKDGSIFTAEISANVISWNGRQAVAEVIRDVTERRLLQSALRGSDTEFRMLGENSVTGIYMADDTFHLIYANQRLIEILGYSAEEIRERDFRSFIVEEDAQEVVDNYVRRRRGENVTNHLKLRIIRKDGELRWLDLRVASALSHQGSIYSWGHVLDVTEQKMAEEALRQSEERYRTITDLMSDYAASAKVQPDGSLTFDWYTRDALVRLTGYTPEEINQEGFNAIHPDDVGRANNDMKEVMAGKTIASEYRIITKRGTIRWMHYHRRPIWDKSGQHIEGYLLVANDITERKQAEEALRQSEERYREISELMSDYAASVKLQPDGRVHWEWSTEASFTRITGYTVEEVQNSSDQLLHFHPEDRERVQKDVNEAAAGKSSDSEYRIVTKNGELRWMHYYRRPVWDENHEYVLRYLLVAKDITERKLAEEALQQSEERYRAISELMSDYAYSIKVNPDGSTVGEWWTEASLARLTGYHSQDIEGPTKLYHPDDAERALNDVMKVISGQPTDSEYRIITASGELRWRHHRRQPVWDEQQQRVVRFLGVVKDITERKLAEEALRESEERYREITELMSDYAYSYKVEPDSSLTRDWFIFKPLARVLKYTPEDIMTLPGYDMFHPEDRARAKKDVEDVIAGKPTDTEYRLLDKNGDVHWMHYYRRPIWDESGQRVARFLGVAKDITAQKEAEEAEREHRVLLEALLDVSSALTSTLDFDDLLDRILINVGKVLPHDAADIMLFDSGAARLVRRLGHEKFAESVLLAQNVESIIARSPNLKEIVATRRPLVIPDVQNYPGWIVLPSRVWLRSYAGVPILIDGEVIGILNLDSGTPNFFSSDTIERLNLFSSQLAIAVQNARLYGQAQELAAMNERQRLARDLHDSVTQTLFSASMVAETLPRLWPDSPPKLKIRLLELNNLTRQALAEMRSLLLELRPNAMVNASVEELFAQLAEVFQRRSRTELSVQLEGAFQLPPEVKIVLYRVAQEALNNIAKHARATQVSIRLVESGSGFILHIQDNGRGFDAAQAVSGHYGLQIIQERAASVGAALTLISQPKAGTQIRLAWSSG